MMSMHCDGSSVLSKSKKEVCVCYNLPVLLHEKFIRCLISKRRGWNITGGTRRYGTAINDLSREGLNFLFLAEGPTVLYI